MVRTAARMLAAAWLTAIAGCYGRPDTLGDPCRVDADCDDGQRCHDRLCRSPRAPDGTSTGQAGTSGTGSGSGSGATATGP